MYREWCFLVCAIFRIKIDIHEYHLQRLRLSVVKKIKSYSLFMVPKVHCTILVIQAFRMIWFQRAPLNGKTNRYFMDNTKTHMITTICHIKVDFKFNRKLVQPLYTCISTLTFGSVCGNKQGTRLVSELMGNVRSNSSVRRSSHSCKCTGNFCHTVALSLTCSNRPACGNSSVQGVHVCFKANTI